MEFPRNQLEAEFLCADEERSRHYLTRLRWPDGPACSKCNGRRCRWHSRGRLRCRSCGHEGSLLAGTLFQGSHLPVSQWLRAIWLVTSQKSGASSLGIQRALGIGSYRTAWAISHRLRLAMVRDGREKLKGEVEVDEMFFGSKVYNIPGKSGKALKTPILIAAEVQGNGIGRIRMRRARNIRREALENFIFQNIEPGSTVHTDGNLAYWSLNKRGFKHKPSVIPNHFGMSSAAAKKIGKEAVDSILPGVNRVTSLLRRWMDGTHHGGFDLRYLDRYLDEFVFRFNRRTSRSRGLLFYRLCSQMLQKTPVTIKSIRPIPLPIVDRE